VSVPLNENELLLLTPPPSSAQRADLGSVCLVCYIRFTPAPLTKIKKDVLTCRESRRPLNWDGGDAQLRAVCS